MAPTKLDRSKIQCFAPRQAVLGILVELAGAAVLTIAAFGVSILARMVL